MNLHGHAAHRHRRRLGPRRGHRGACAAKPAPSVAILDLNAEAAEARRSAIGGLAVACDVADAASAEAAVAAAAAAHGPARVLVNCAGIGTAERIVGRDGPQALAAFETVIRVNLIGTFNMLRLAAAAMAKLDAARRRRARRHRQHRLGRGL